VRVADEVVDPVERDERLGVAGSGDDPAASGADTTGSVGACRTSTGTRVDGRDRGAGEATVTTPRIPGIAAAVASTAGPGVE
jgi:hypothetical protein